MCMNTQDYYILLINWLFIIMKWPFLLIVISIALQSGNSDADIPNPNSALCFLIVTLIITPYSFNFSPYAL